MALGGAKEPQQFNILSFFAEMFDFVIFIDGFNEINAFPSDEFPIEFPVYSRVLFSKDTSYFEDIAKIEYLRNLKSSIQKFPVTNFPFAYSSSYFLIADCLSRIIESRISASIERLYDASSAKRNFYGHILSEEEKLERGAEIWKRYIELSHVLLEHFRIPHVFSLQPNQYDLNNGKIFSKEEQKIAFHPSRISANRNGYRALHRRLNELHKSGIPVVDLTGIYRNITDPIYVDDCCHVNKTGNRIIAKALIPEIERALNMAKSKSEK